LEKRILVKTEPITLENIWSSSLSSSTLKCQFPEEEEKEKEEQKEKEKRKKINPFSSEKVGSKFTEQSDRMLAWTTKIRQI